MSLKRLLAPFLVMAILAAAMFTTDAFTNSDAADAASLTRPQITNVQPAPAPAAAIARPAVTHETITPATFYTFQWTDCFSNGWCRVTTAVCSDESTFSGNPCQYYYYWYRWADK